MVDSFIKQSEIWLKLEKQTKQLSKIFHRSSWTESAFPGQLQGSAQRAFGPAFQFVADRPVIGPNQAFGMLGSGIDQHHSPLKIIDQNFVGLVGKLVDQARKKSLGLVGPT